MEWERGADGVDNEILLKRISRLEERLEILEGRRVPRGAVHPAWSLALAGTASVFGVLGMGIPTHPYQYLFAALLLVLAYHRRWLRPARDGWRWPLVAANFAGLALFLLIVLGGGVRKPLVWLRTPGIVKAVPPENTTWYGKALPDYSLQWQEVPGLSDWSIDLTKIQAFLLIATLAGALFRFQGFTSVTALVLLLVSLPAYLSFAWDWVLPYLIVLSISFYLQALPETAGEIPLER